MRLIGEQTRLWGINPTLSIRALSSGTNQGKKTKQIWKNRKEIKVSWHFKGNRLLPYRGTAHPAEALQKETSDCH